MVRAAVAVAVAALLAACAAEPRQPEVIGPEALPKVHPSTLAHCTPAGAASEYLLGRGWSRVATHALLEWWVPPETAGHMMILGRLDGYLCVVRTVSPQRQEGQRFT